MRGSSGRRIAEAALAILVDEGADAVTMRRVATAAGVTPMATYKHFANREALLRTVADIGFQQVTETWGERGTGEDFEGRLYGLADDFLDFALGKPHLYHFLVTDRREHVRRFPEDFRDGGSPALSPVVEVVEMGMRQGVLRADDPLEVTVAITANTQGLVQLYLGGRIGLSEQDFRALCKRTVARILDGLRS